MHYEFAYDVYNENKIKRNLSNFDVIKTFIEIDCRGGGRSVFLHYLMNRGDEKTRQIAESMNAMMRNGRNVTRKQIYAVSMFLNNSNDSLENLLIEIFGPELKTVIENGGY